MITHVLPVAVQRGKIAEVTVAGVMNFAGTYKALFEGSGIQGKVMADDALKTKAKTLAPINTVRLKLTVSADAALGVREFRLASHRGLSSIGQLLVVDDPVVVESGDNNTRAQANPIPMPAVVCGRIESREDVDFFKFHAAAGQTVTCEAWCARLEDKIHDLQKHADPLLTLFDSDGRELAANDDSLFADPLLSYSIAQTGTYYIQIRDSKYDGDPRWVYALCVSSRPYVTNVYPMAGNPGREVEVEPIGSAHDRQAHVKLRAPGEPGMYEVPLDVGGTKTNPAPFLVSPLPQVLEHEPNDTPEQANRITIPCGINGRIGRRRDLDHFVFRAVKGQAVRFEVKARRFGTALHSSLDSVLDIMTPKGAIVANNDDTALDGYVLYKDSSLVFTPPADGDYILRIRDLNNKGGDTAVYFIEADWARPDFTLRTDPDKAMLGPGASSAWHVHLTRLHGFMGPVKVEVEGLPAGVTASSLTIPPAMTQGLVVLTAAADAPQTAVNVRLIGTATVALPGGRQEQVRHEAAANEEIYFPGGGRGLFDVHLRSVAVTDPGDILKVAVSSATLTLKPGEERRLDVTIQRRPDYTKDVSLDVRLQHLGRVFGNPLPPGVSFLESKSKTLLGSGNRGHIVLKAAPDAAPIADVPISVQAFVSINFVVKVGYSSPAIGVSVK
jgi:hypothetical protein